MRSKQDLLDLLNYCKPFLYSEISYPISLAQLTYHANPAGQIDRYKTFSIKKKSGGERIINSPNSGLKCIQRCLNLIFQTIYEPSISANGFVNGRSILTNAKVHTGFNYVYNIDLKDFFGSVDQARVWGRLQKKPFSLNKESNRLEIANIIASLCCHELEVDRLNSENQWETLKKNVLPQGAPTSPTLTNIICQQLDFYLSAVAKRFGLNYSRYADDITFSSMHNVYQDTSDFTREIKRIISSQNFHIKGEKTRLQTSGYRQTVTGVTVNNKPNLPPKYKKDIKMWLYFWEIYGYEKANAIYIKELGNKSGIEMITGTLILKEMIFGKLNFYKMIKGIDDQCYKLMSEKFNGLDNKLKQIKTKVSKSDSSTGSIELINLPVFHRPYELVQILKCFTIENSVLKFATHSWDAGNDENQFDGYLDFIGKARKQFDRVNLRLKILSPQLRAKILAFLFNENVGENGWGTHRIKIGWSSPEIAETLINRSEIKPENIYLPKIAHFIYNNWQGNQTVQRFKQVIDIFKNEIEIRDENSALLNIILWYHDHFLGGFKIKSFDNFENKSFYTDVDYLLKVLDVVFRGIQSRTMYKEVSYHLVDNPDFYELIIVQHDSFCKGISLNDAKFNLTRGDYASIKNWLNNLCDWSIESEFAEGIYRLNFLTSDRTCPKAEKKRHTEGFKHIFKFYK